ncbi:hypothetical protein K1T71_004355 [Dendrolimus kikuchii]|uniref:Uncharacterized protein n=1 Tax=Dendrolimus kikuchii TaxID=765133 RepID=A0ACC1D729_9NEOP|nr:hypothetical protein K1T71_004355 [Dendrolimus kikuchii]
MEESIPTGKVTRLRRRLSVEAEDAKSPSTPSTPTKKRGGRLAIKPQLELIDENAHENIPKRATRKSIAKEIELVEDKVLTPSRRSARIKSNTSIVSETPLGLDSPRARRATRRSSQVGSDAETPLTPARQTRRTRKDSSSSIDKPIDNIAIKTIDNIIIEEQDTNNEGEENNEKKYRKSPRLSGNNKTSKLKVIDTSDETQNDKVTTSNDSETKRNANNQSLIDNTPVLSVKDTINSTEAEPTTDLTLQDKNEISASSLNVSNDEKENLSVSSSNLLKTMNTDPKKIREFFNKSTPNLIEPSKFKSKRHRTKSFTTNTGSFDNETYFLSDNETAKKKIKNKMIDLNFNKSSGDGTKPFISQKQYDHKEIIPDTRQDHKSFVISMTDEVKKSDVEENNKTSHNKEHSPQCHTELPTTKLLLQHEPSDFQISVVLESDSNSSTDKKDAYQHLHSEDQCVPVVDTKANTSCEPMDIDETIPGNISIHDSSENSGPSETIAHATNKFKKKSLSGAQNTIEEINSSRHKTSLNIALEDKHILEKEKENTVNIVENRKKSKRNSSMLENQGDFSKESNRSRRNSSGNVLLRDTEQSNDEPNKSLRKYSLSDSFVNHTDSNNSSKKSKKKSSFLMETEDDIVNNDDFDSKNSLSTYTNKTTEIFTNAEDIINKSKRKSSIDIHSNDTDVTNKSHKRKSSISITTQDHVEDTKDHDDPETTSTQMILSEYSLNEKHIRSKKKSFGETSALIANADESCKIYIKEKSISQIETINSLDKSNNGNKSTLILSQIKDVSHETSNFSKSPKLHKKNLMAKSLDNLNITKDKDYDKKNVSINCLTTSTPLQQKPLKKLGLLVDTSNISLKDKKKEKNSITDIMKDKSSDKTFNGTSDDDESNTEVNSSADGNNMIVDEAEEASDDYESGDSRDDEEREYEEDNEITEKGETLDSEEDYSDDTDYEKDSFVVSSDEEDNDLLSGSGDDLSMSNNELTMSKKSKNKYNDRKSKEQKKASKEMYDARHKLDESDKTMSKNKKSKRQRIDSSLITTDDEGPTTQIKKNKRMRIDSSHDASNIESGLNTSVSKKKNKKTSKSFCNENTLNEQEITIYEPNETERDPLLVCVKKEPKTPQKDPEISNVCITIMQDVEEVQVDENHSIVGKDETSDPLQATMMAENNDDSSLSENPEIMENYDSLLNNLSSVKSKQVKTMDISLNIEKKSKKNVKAPIFDELNLTQIESKKNKNIDTTEPIKGSKPKSKVVQTIASDTESSSNSIDMKLLFSEDSNDYVVNTDAPKVKEKNSDIPQDFIPLKKSDGATNISLVKDAKETENVCFFIDTKGTHEESEIAVNTSKDSSKKKNHEKNITIDSGVIENGSVKTLYTSDKNKKKPKLSLSYDTNNYAENADSSNEVPLEVSFTKKKKKGKYNLDNSKTKIEEVDIATMVDEVPIEKCLGIEGTKKKKKSKEALNIQENAIEQQQVTEENADLSSEGPIEVSFTKKKKKTKHGADNSKSKIEEEHRVIEDIPLHKTDKKKGSKDSHHTDSDVHNVEDVPPIPMEQKRKKKSKNSSNDSIMINQKQENVSEETINFNNEDIIPTSKKRKRKSSANITEIASFEDAAIVVEESSTLEKTIGNKKKKRKITQTDEESAELQTKLEMTKNKKRKNANKDDAAQRAKVQKQKSTEIHVPRLPETIISQLSDKPKTQMEKKKYAISTTPFVIEEILKQPTKPSNYLEESVYLNESPKAKKQKYSFKNVKVLPFVPTATTSYKGYTTDFKVKVLEEDTNFIAQAAPSHNFKQNFLQNNRNKKLGTLEKYKKFRNEKMWKF